MISDLGAVVSVSGKRATAILRPQATDSGPEQKLAIGRLVAVRSETALTIGVVASVTEDVDARGGNGRGPLSVDVDLLGEILNYGTEKAYFQRGVSEYPTIGDMLLTLGTDELELIHSIHDAETIDVGRLKLDSELPAYINFDDMLRKHFAILGATGVGKSSAVALILRKILEKGTNLRILLFDPHAEYGHSFGDMANVLLPQNLRLPFWLFNLDELSEVLFRGHPNVEREIEVLAELLPRAKARFAAKANFAARSMEPPSKSDFTPDSPVPYLMSDLVELLNDRIGRLENRSTALTFNRLISRIEALTQDARYSFMFNREFVHDVMPDVLGTLFRLPLQGQPITIVQIAGFPADVVDSVVSVLCRLAFEVGVWSDGSVPLLVACEEAHRYAPSDPANGFWPTRRAISRIAKEGRKYSVFLGVITQRPADLDETILSQCNTVFAMRLANDNDQAIIKSAVPDAGSSLLEVLSSLGVREAIAFGEGVALPTRIHFGNLAKEFLPYSQTESQFRPGDADTAGNDFVEAVVRRWRGEPEPQPKREASQAETTEVDEFTYS